MSWVLGFVHVSFVSPFRRLVSTMGTSGPHQVHYTRASTVKTSHACRRNGSRGTMTRTTDTVSHIKTDDEPQPPPIKQTIPKQTAHSPVQSK